MSHIWRLQKIGIGKESSHWTAVSPTYWIPKLSWSIKPIMEKIKDDSGIWRIEEVFDSRTVKEMSETTIEAYVRDNYIGLFFLGALWQVSTSTDDPEAGVNTHTFTVKNDNDHPSFTLQQEDGVQIIRSTYNMVETLDIEAVAWEFVKATIGFKGKKVASTSTASPSYSIGNEFTGAMCSVKFADTYSWLSSASAVELSSVKLSIEKNLIDYQAIGDTDVNSIFNQQFTLKWDLEALFTSTTYRDYVINSSKKYMRITLEDTNTTIWTTSHPKIVIDLYQVSFEDWGVNDDNNWVITQTMGFVPEYSTTEGKAIQVV